MIIRATETPGTASNQAERTRAAITGGTVGFLVPMLIGLAMAAVGLVRRQ